MTPDETADYYDDPDKTTWACGVLMRSYPGWIVARDPSTHLWSARHESWPDERPSLTRPLAGLLNEAINNHEPGFTTGDPQ